MNYFKEYSSNTYAGSGNQLYFNMNEGEIRTGRVFYKISVAGEYSYSILFSNIVDSTYENGEKSYKNLICDKWTIHNAKVGKCTSINITKEITEITMSDSDENSNTDIVVYDLKDITFNGQPCKSVKPGEFFSSDPVTHSFGENEYLCLEITFSGRMIPYHEETLLPVFIKEKGKWTYCKYMPFAGMIGCDRKVKKRVGYLGDSITQGIGTAINSYLHWNALLSQNIGSEYAFWNLGIGYGRASDAASDGAWLYKAKQNDIVFICYGVNDLLNGHSEEQIQSDLTRIVDILKKNDKKVILQTLPPFDYSEKNTEKWQRINNYLKTVLKDKVDYLFDPVPYLEGEAPGSAKFGGHPNEEGCKIWSDALWQDIKGFFR